MDKCIYCGEEKQRVPLLPQPKYFVHKKVRVSLPDEGKLVCIKCLNFEIEELKQLEETEI